MADTNGDQESPSSGEPSSADRADPPATTTPGTSPTPPDKPKRNKKGQYKTGESGNKAGRKKGVKNYNTQLWAEIKKFKSRGTKEQPPQGYIHALLQASLDDPSTRDKIIDKLFHDATPKGGDVPAVQVNAGNTNNESRSINHILSDPKLRALACSLEEGIADRMADTGGTR